MSTRPVNDDDYDPVLDACLAEYLGGETPPDLSERIMTAWKARQEAAGNLSAAHRSRAGVSGEGPRPSGHATSSADSHRNSSPPLVVGTKIGPVEQSFRPSESSNGSIRVSRPTGSGARSTSSGRSSSGKQAATGSWMSLATIAATLVVGVGLGIAGLYLIGPM